VARPEDTLADALARLYDVDLQVDPGDVDLYLALAGRTGGPILEVGVGSGRIAVALAAAGHEVTGVDLDPAMLRRARERAVRAGRATAARLTLVEGDARALPNELGSFRLAFVALNSLLVFGGRADQRATLRSLGNHLEPGALVVVDVWLPDADDLARYDGRVGLEYARLDPETGNHVVKLASAYHDSASGTVELTAIFDEGRQGESSRRWIREDTLRLVGADELRAFAEDAGLLVETIAGGYDLAPITAGDDRAILVAARPESTSSRPRRRTGSAPSGTAQESAGGPGLV
jgi:SAM-dependent methyltransferase